MSRSRRWTVVAVAWAASITWVVAAMLAGPSDGSVLSTAAEDGWWGSGPTVARTYGDTPLRPGDTVRAVDGRPLSEWLSSGSAPEREVGDVVTYEVRRPAAGLDRILELEVTLTGFPLAAAVRDPACALCLLVLAAGSAAFLRRPGATSARAFLAAGALLPAAMTSAPWGVAPVDLAGSRGIWPQVGGEVLAALGAVAVLVAVATLAPPTTRRSGSWVTIAALLVPFAGYGAWLGLALPAIASEADRLQALSTVLVPAAAASVPAVLVVAGLGLARAVDRTDVLAARLLLLGTGSGLVAWLLLDLVPRWSLGHALLSRELVLLVVAPVVLGSIGAAVGHYRLSEMEPLFRRVVVQASVLVLVASAFAGIVRAADVAADISVSSMLVGGVAALALLPVGVAVQRALRRAVFGDRESHRVVSDLRRLDLLTAPEEALRGMLELLARRLHLSYAAVEVFATHTSDTVATSIGTPYASPATIDLVAGGTTLGRLEVEVDAAHDPFGPGDRRLLEDVGGQVGALVQAVTINRELQRARQRLVEAREEERRRIRRDLHDGLGPSLATLAMRLEVAQELIADDPAGAADLVGDLSEAARNEIAEVRRLVDGLRPPALDQLGLVSALRQRAAEQVGGRAAARVPWRVDASADIDPLPAAVEVAAYRIAIEAVNNAQRHSGADQCVVTLGREPAALQVTIRDTGAGLAPDHPVGVGLSSMRERAEELGGTFELWTDPGRGTTIRVRLPVGQDLEEDGPG